ncbi:hypothetical protein, partial [Escherichia coli]|uniref:hypothetical protein n=1 Tax=Escherichia coli TaxID=562 RepID=UPI001CA51C0A
TGSKGWVSISSRFSDTFNPPTGKRQTAGFCTKPPNTASLQTALSRPAVFGYNADIKRIL